MAKNEANRGSIASDGITFQADHRFDPFKVVKRVVWNSVFVIFFIFATLNFVKKSIWKVALFINFCLNLNFVIDQTCKVDCDLNFCSPYFLFLLIAIVVYFGIFYCKVVKKYFEKFLITNCIEPVKDLFRKIFKTLWVNEW